MPLVVDTSVVLTWCMGDESDAVADRALELAEDDAIIVPWIGWYEVRNVLIVNERRGRIDPASTARFLGYLRTLDMTFDANADEATVMALARDYQLTVYDAAYLELAGRLAAPLATLDKKLRKAGKDAGVEVLA